MNPIQCRFNLQFIFCIILINLYFGCYNPERDLVVDPYNTPIIHFLNANYKEEDGFVNIRWEYIGREPVIRFMVNRQVFNVENLPREIANIPVVELKHKNLIVGSFQDTSPVSGERISYWVTADLGNQRETTTERRVEVDIPGAHFGGVRRNPFNGSVEVFWTGNSEGVSAYEIIRRSSNRTEELVFRTEGSLDNLFLDETIRGNLTYTYTIWTSMLNGTRLKSREIQTGLFSLASKRKIEILSGPEERVRLSSGLAFSEASLLALVVKKEQTTIAKIQYKTNPSYDGSLEVFRRSFVTIPLDIGSLIHASIGIAGPSVLGQSVARMYLGGVHSETGQVVIKAYGLPNIQPVWIGPGDWYVSNFKSQIAIYSDSKDRLFVALGRELRIYDFVQDQVHTVSLNLQDPLDLLVSNDVVWIVYPHDSALFRGDMKLLSGSISDVFWEKVFLPSGVQPVALTQNRFGLIFVLDAGNREVISFDTVGNRILEWSLPNGDYFGGDLTSDISGYELIHVSDTVGNVFTFLP